MKILITGGTGFIGSYVVFNLSKKHKITILARKPEKIPAFTSIPSISLKKFDLKNYKTFKNFCKNYDCLILIALGWGETGPLMIENETLPQVFMIDAAIKAGIKKIIFTSSTAALGHITDDKDETAKPEPFDFYGATKASVELFINAYSNYYRNVYLNVIRPGYTFGNPVIAGAPMEPDNRFREIIKRVKNNQTVEVIKNDGTQFIWAGDLAKIYEKILESKCKNEIFFGLSQNFITWEQIAIWAFEFSGKKPKIKLKNLGWSEKPAIYSVEKIKKYFGLSFNSEEKIKDHIKYLLTIL